MAIEKKTVFLYVTGEDFSAMHFEKHYDPKEFYKEMVEDDVQERVIEASFYAEVKILEFGEIDKDFIDYVKSNLIDYDHSKDSNLYHVESYKVFDL